MSAKGRYLFASSRFRELSSISTSSEQDGGRGYNHTARWLWLATTATWFALLIARWAFINTSMLAIAFERGRVGERRAQAWGLVSRTMTRSEGEGPVIGLDQSLDNVQTALPSASRS